MPLVDLMNSRFCFFRRAQTGNDKRRWTNLGTSYHVRLEGKTMPTALITGIAGQDGSYLSEFLLEKGYRVVGTVPDCDPVELDRIRHLLGRIELVQDDLLGPGPASKRSSASIARRGVQLRRPTRSWRTRSSQPIRATEVIAMGVTRLLEAIRKITPEARFFQASSSEIFGKPGEIPQSETTPFHPRNPYGVSKVYGHLMTDHLPGELRPVRLLRDPVQPREPAAQPGVRHPEDHARRGADPAGARQGAPAREPGRPPRLGIRRGLRPGHVAHAAAGPAGRLRPRHRGDPFRPGPVRRGVLPRGARLPRIRRAGSRVFPASRDGATGGEPREGPGAAGVEAAGHLPGTGPDDGGCGPGAGEDR